MPIQQDIIDHDYLGPILRRRCEEERIKGRIEGQTEFLLKLLRKRFGAVPPRIRKRLSALEPDQLKAACLRLLDARRMEDIFSD